LIDPFAALLKQADENEEKPKRVRLNICPRVLVIILALGITEVLPFIYVFLFYGLYLTQFYYLAVGVYTGCVLEAEMEKTRLANWDETHTLRLFKVFILQRNYWIGDFMNSREPAEKGSLVLELKVLRASPAATPQAALDYHIRTSLVYGPEHNYLLAPKPHQWKAALV
jgi:hypothetical protein